MRMQHTSLAQEQAGYPPRTHTPPSHERNVSATFPSSQAQHPRYDPRQEAAHQHGPGSSAHQRHSSASGMPAVADQGMEAQYRRIEDPRQRQQPEYQEHQRYAQKQTLEHPESMRQAPPPQEPSSRQRPQEWGYVVDPATQYSSPSGNSSRVPAHYGGQGVPQEHLGHGHPSHYQSGGPPPQSSHMQQHQQPQYYQGQEREHLQHTEPVAPAPTGKKTKAAPKAKAQAVPKQQQQQQQQEDDERSLRSSSSSTKSNTAKNSLATTPNRRLNI
ncbi:hypothetical protein BGX24_008653 [Mortierella sp. AD032]|nr:hypothetical protein BGX24_008653 [Mortierella sp. AD032]